MPERKTLQRAARDKKQGKSPSTQAGEFVREEIDHVREGKHGVRSTKQAIAIGLSKARRAGVALPSPKKAGAATRRKAKQDSEAAHDGHAKSATRARATTRALKRESAKPASKSALSRHASKTASRRTAADRSAAAKKAAATKGAAGRSAAAKKAARTRAANRAAAHH
ncbi:ku family containing domain-containing protein [Achromobacter xylosoxidans]|nr:ku family containing domain-containing protein [Achromobacter xylosoxidans]ODA19263.1 ku family containing domain-containing protein [Achromobacter xylosoxidans]